MINSNKNLGFSKAVNVAIKNVATKYILLLNPDSVLIKDNLQELVKIATSNDNISIVGGEMVNGKGQKYYSATDNVNFLYAVFEFTILKKIFSSYKWANNFWLEKRNKSKTFECWSVCGAYMLFRRHINHKLNLFDERYFLYLEDLDFCLKNINLGKKVIFTRQTTIIHLGGQSTSNKYHMNLDEWYKSRKKFFEKQLSSKEFLFLDILYTLEEIFLKSFSKAKCLLTSPFSSSQKTHQNN